MMEIQCSRVLFIPAHDTFPSKHIYKLLFLLASITYNPLRSAFAATEGTVRTWKMFDVAMHSTIFNHLDDYNTWC